LWQYHAAGEVQDRGEYERIQEEIAEQLAAFIPDKIFKTEVKAEFSKVEEYNDGLQKVIFNCAIMIFLDENYDEARKWRTFLQDRLPDYPIGSIADKEVLPYKN
jgi:hypothetical protein